MTEHQIQTQGLEIVVEGQTELINEQKEEIKELKKCLGIHRNVMKREGSTQGCLWKMTNGLLGEE